MHQSHFNQDAFIAPNGQNIEQIKHVIDSITELIITYASTSAQRTPLPQIAEYSYGPIPEQGFSVAEIMQQVQGIVERSLNSSHPRFIGHMDSIPTLMSILGDFISSTLNNNMLSLEMSPVFSQIEVQVLKEIARHFGYGETAGGVMMSGGTLANLQALTVARNHVFAVREEGLTGFKGQPVLFASEVAHTSLQKVTMILGIGISAVIPIRTNSNSQMRIEDLEAKIQQALAQGKKPFAIVATAGTTVTGNIDPISEIVSVAKRHQLWLHVDAAYGGALIFSPKHRGRLKGIEEADSITFNPQKWMYIAKTCAMVLFKDADILQREFRVSAPYMNDTAFTNLGEISVQGTRHADIMKLWLSLQHIGAKGYERLIDDSYERVQFFVEQIKRRPYLELASKPDTNICCFRGKPEHIQSEEWDEWNLQLQKELLSDGQTFFSFPTYRGSRWLRAVLLNPFTTQEDIQKIFDQIDQYYEKNRPFRS